MPETVMGLAARALRALACLAALAVASGWAAAAGVQVAVAANFAAPAKALAADFRKATGHTAAVSLGSTGKLHAQIANGAPFEVLLAADDTTGQKLEAAGLAVAGSRFTYAVGRLVLWSARPGTVDAAGDVLKAARFSHLAIANPRLAPYGAAAVATLRNLGLYETLEPKLVTGENITQAHQYVASGNAELGFVALSQVFDSGRFTGGSAWLVPQRLHAPIRQDAALLVAGRDNAAARAWLAFLKTNAARETIRRYGYEVPTE